MAPYCLTDPYWNFPKHTMEILEHYCTLVKGHHQSLLDFPHEGLEMCSVDVFFLGCLKKWLNNQWVDGYLKHQYSNVKSHNTWSPVVPIVGNVDKTDHVISDSW